MGTVIIIASILKKACISSAVDLLERTRPGIDAPVVTESMLASTQTDIIPGMLAGLNQLLPMMEAEFRIKIFPIAANTEPARHNSGC